MTDARHTEKYREPAADYCAIRRRWRRGTLREVGLEQDGRVIRKTFWVAPGVRRFDHSWAIEYNALRHLEKSVKCRPIACDEWNADGGLSAYVLRTYVAGTPVGRDDLLPDLATLTAAIHTAGVVTHDLNMGNLIRLSCGTLEFIDFGRAEIFKKKTLRFYAAIGRELARSYFEVFSRDQNRFSPFLAHYFQESQINGMAAVVARLSCQMAMRARMGRHSYSKTSKKPAPEDAVIKRAERLPTGQLHIVAPREETVAIEEFVRNPNLSQLPEGTLIATHNRRYRIWPVKLADNRFVLKMSWANPDYRTARYLGLCLSQQITNVARKAFRGAQLLNEAGIPSVEPVAWWTERKCWYDRRHYFLMRHIEHDNDVRSILMSLPPDDPTRLPLVERVAETVGKLFENKLRHDDLAVGNFLAKYTPENGWMIWLIDTDSISCSRIRTPFIKQFFDLCCLRRLNLRGTEREHFLRIVLGDTDTMFWRRVLEFWINGGNKRPIRAMIKTLRNRCNNG